MRRVCVFCGSLTGDDPAFLDAARRLGRSLAARGLGLVYGGGSVGLMEALALAAQEAGGEVTGVIPRALLDREVGLTSLKDLRVVESMHERKALMAELSDGFIALPGGIGTLEEFFEVWTWAQLGMHHKPIALLNAGAYFDPLIAFLDSMVARSFLRAPHRELVFVESEPEALLDRFEAYVPPEVYVWIDPRST
jgi:uncharacterized protein (TIGR00730 family)